MQGLFYRCDKLLQQPTEFRWMTLSSEQFHTVGLIEGAVGGTFERHPDVSPSECFWTPPLWEIFERNCT